MDTVSDGTCAASSTQWLSLTLIGSSSHVNAENLTYSTAKKTSIQHSV